MSETSQDEHDGTDDDDATVPCLLKEIEKLETRLSLIDVGCFNCGGLPHTKDCRVRDVKALLTRAEEAEAEVEKLQLRLTAATRTRPGDWDNSLMELADVAESRNAMLKRALEKVRENVHTQAAPSHHATIQMCMQGLCGVANLALANNSESAVLEELHNTRALFAKLKTELESATTEKTKSLEAFRERFLALLRPDPDKVTGRGVEAGSASGRNYLQVAGIIVAIEGEGRSTVEPMNGSWTKEQFKYIETLFFEATRAAFMDVPLTLEAP